MSKQFSTHILAVCFQNFVGHGTYDINGRSKEPSQYYWKIWIVIRLITKHDPLIPIILADVADVIIMSVHASLGNFAIKSIVTMDCMGSNQGLQLNTVIPQTLGRSRIDKFS